MPPFTCSVVPARACAGACRPFDLIVRHGTVLTPNGRERIDRGIRNGRFVAFGVPTGTSPAQELDATGLHVLPGVIDTQVHFREPRFEPKEDLHTSRAAAAAGGVVALFEMPNTKPSTTTAELLADKLARARGRMWTDHAFYIGGTAENADQLGLLERRPGCCGVKVFMGSSTGSLLVADDANLERIVRYIQRRMAVH